METNTKEVTVAFERPLTIYVAFHPHSPECRELADHLHDWFRLKGDDGDGTDAGLPIWFRSAVDKDDGLAPPIDWPDAQLNVLVALVDDRMVDDRSWRIALERACHSAGDTHVILPVPIDVSAYRLRYLFATRNRLYPGDPRPDDEKEPGDETNPEKAKARTNRIAKRARILRRAVTEAITRELRERNPASPAGPGRTPPDPLDVFLSHAKYDGREIARNLRDGMADFGQLKTWFDENDLPPGYAWTSPMVEAVERETAALISIVTDAYSTRPWCRKEVNLARTPRVLELGPPAENATARVTAFTVQPSVAVTQGRGSWSRPMAQLAQVPHLGWPDQSDDITVCIADVVDRLLLEALLVTFYRRIAPELAELYRSGEQNIALLTWVPDPWSLAHVRAKLLEDDPEARWVLAYPGHGLRSAEREELHFLLRSMEAGREETSEPQFQLMTQERLQQLDLDIAPRQLEIAVSGGGRASDVESAGLGMKHLDDLMVRITRRLLEQGHRVFYGGSLSDYTANLTQAIIATAQGWDQISNDDPVAHITARPLAKDLETPPLVNYAAWPFYRYIQPRQRAELTGICAFELINPVGDDEPPSVSAADAREREDPEHARMMAMALSRMRERSARESKLRIVMGGKVRGWQGWLPGIVEEVVCSLEAQRLPLIIGGFGGCASQLAAYLLDQSTGWPKALSFDAAKRSDPAFGLLLRSDGAVAHAKASFEHAEAMLAAYRRQLHSDDEWPFAADVSHIRDLLGSGSPSHAIDRVLRVVYALSAHPQSPIAPTAEP